MGRGTAILAKMDLKITFEKKGWNYEVQVCLTLTKNVEKFEKKFPQLLFQIFFCTSCMSKSTIDVSGFAAGTHISSIAISLYIFNLSMYVCKHRVFKMDCFYSKQLLWFILVLVHTCHFPPPHNALNNFHGKKMGIFDSFQNCLK